MKPFLGVVLLVALLQPARAQRQVATTIDDGPVVGELENLSNFERVSAGLVGALVSEQVPSTIFHQRTAGTWHQFRHIHSSLRNDLNVPVKIAQEQLGHASIATTMNIYTYTHAVDAPHRKGHRAGRAQIVRRSEGDHVALYDL